MRPATLPVRLLRLVTATALALSWSVVAALPAPAAVTGWGVQTPSAGAVLERATDLVVYVDRTHSPEPERVEVRTRMLGPSSEPVSDRVITLKLKRQIPNDAGEQLLFGGTIDPYQLDWLADGGVAANGSYTLQIQIHVVTGELERTSDWNDHPLVLDAPPVPPGQPEVTVADAAAKRLQISWAPSPTPDLLHYSVERRVDGGQWQMAQELVAPDVTKITDTVASYGSYRYRVTAVRPDGDGSQEFRATVSEPSWTTEVAAPQKPAQRGNAATAGQGSGSSTTGTRARIQAPAPRPQPPQFRAPIDANQTYSGPLDYGVEPSEVTERVPIEVARGGTSEDGGVLRVLSRSIDQQRVLPAVAGGLIFLLSAAHVVRYLNE
jgi:hypothetical protein